jgi:preprotein translocase subunit SecG
VKNILPRAGRDRAKELVVLAVVVAAVVIAVLVATHRDGGSGCFYGNGPCISDTLNNVSNSL